MFEMMMMMMMMFIIDSSISDWLRSRFDFLQVQWLFQINSRAHPATYAVDGEDRVA
jgi:hypothetical protein